MANKLNMIQPNYSELERNIDSKNKYFSKIAEIIEFSMDEIRNFNDSSFFVNTFENKAPSNQNFINHQYVNDEATSKEALLKTIEIL
jgi:hypothetical protein